MKCPLCKSRLDIRLDGFTCQAAANGPYAKGSIRLTCSGKECRYMHSTLVQATDAKLLATLEETIGKMVAKLPGLGPWKCFAIKEGERKRKR